MGWWGGGEREREEKEGKTDGERGRGGRQEKLNYSGAGKGMTNCVLNVLFSTISHSEVTKRVGSISNLTRLTN